jgi:hypothetical protein
MRLRRYVPKRADGGFRKPRSTSTWRRKLQRQGAEKVVSYAAPGDESGMLMTYRRCRRCHKIVALPALHRAQCPQCGARRQ